MFWKRMLVVMSVVALGTGLLAGLLYSGSGMAFIFFLPAVVTCALSTGVGIFAYLKTRKNTVA